MVYTDQFKQDLTAVSTNETFLLLLDIYHPTWGQTPPAPYTFHIVNDILGHDVSGITYEPYAFKFTAPQNNTSGATASLELDDVDRRFTMALRGIISRPTCTISLVKASDMTVVEGDAFVFLMHNMKVTKATVTFDLVKETILNNALSGYSIDSIDFPGFFS